MEFKPFDDFREARSVGQAAAARPESNRYKIAEYQEYAVSDCTLRTSYPIGTTAEFFINNARLQSIIIDQRLCAIRIIPHLKAFAYATTPSGPDYQADVAAIIQWMEEQKVSINVDGTPVLNEVPMGSLTDGFTFDPTMMPIPKNTASVVIDFAAASSGSSWDERTDTPVPLTVLSVYMGFLVELWYTP